MCRLKEDINLDMFFGNERRYLMLNRLMNMLIEDYIKEINEYADRRLY